MEMKDDWYSLGFVGVMRVGLGVVRGGYMNAFVSEEAGRYGSVLSSQQDQ